MFGQPRADDEIDMDVMNRLLRQDSAAPVRVNFKPLLIGTLVFAVAASVAGALLVQVFAPAEKTLVLTVTVVGGAFAWPLAVSVAWFGQKRELRRAPERVTERE